MEPDIPKRTNAFIELFPSIGLSSWIGNSAAVLTRCWRGFVVGIKHRRELSCLADLDDHDVQIAAREPDIRSTGTAR
jgi:hypothetical protein